MLRILTTTALVLLLAHTALAEEKAADSGFNSIFNGKDLDGWDGDPRLWSVKDGVIHGETTPENKANGNTFLIWQGGKTENFELHITFRCNATNNSGIQYRSRHITEKPRNKWVVRGYQHEIRNENVFPNISGFIYDEGGKRRRICLVGEQALWTKNGKQVSEEKLIDEAGFKKLFKLNDWNDVIIKAEGSRIRHYMNGKLILDFTDKHPELALNSGVLALQLHAGKPMWVEFKDIQFKSLD